MTARRPLVLVGGLAAELPSGDGIVSDAETMRVMVRNACMVRKSVDQTAADYATAAVVVAWDQEVYDDGGWHDNVTNNTRLTVPAGVTRVRLGAHIECSASTANIMMNMYVRKNNTDSYDGRAGLVAANSPTTAITHIQVASGPIPCVATDYFEVFFQVTTDASLNVQSGRSNFWVEAC